MKKILLILFAIAVAQLAGAQDTIVLTDGVKIPCKVERVDSTYVYYSLSRKKEVRHTSVRYEYVKAIHYYDSLPDQKRSKRPAGRPKNNNISLSAGACFPVGLFASQDITSDRAGLAESGFCGNLSYSHRVASWIGVSVVVFYTSNKINLEDIVEAMSRFYYCPVLANDVKYHTYGAMVGPMASIPVGKFAVLAGLQGGIAQMHIPEIEYIIQTSYAGDLSFKRSKENGNSFVIKGTAGLAYRVTSQWDLFAEAGYLYGNFKFGFYNFTFTNGAFTSRSGYKQKYGNFTVTIGASLRF